MVVAEIAAEVTAAGAGVDGIAIEERNAEASTLVIGTAKTTTARLMRRLRNVSVVLIWLAVAIGERTEPNHHTNF